MPTIIDSSYFIDKLFIPNSVAVPDLQTPPNQSPTNVSKLDRSIIKYEKELLVNALGDEQYMELILHKDDVSGKWFELINGTSYDGKVYNGLKEIIGYYVYVCFLKYEAVQFNTTGLERSNAANSTSVYPTDRLIDYWNDFVVMYQSGMELCGCGSRWMFPLSWSDLYTSSSNFVSLYQFIRDNPDDYDVQYFRWYEIQNTLGV
jgi:hypothetical protein